LKKKLIILITGCSTGIGRETVNAFIKQGHQVFATARQQQDLDALKAIGAEAVFCELSDPESIKECFNTVIELSNGQLDVLINNAAFGQGGAVSDIDFLAMRQQFDVNVFGTMELTRLALPFLHQSSAGKIIFISSILGVVTAPFLAVYSATKHALESFASGLRMELNNSRIKVVMIRPGEITTAFKNTALAKFSEKVNLDQSEYAQHYHDYLSKNPLSRNPGAKQPIDVVRVIQKAIKAKRPRIAYYITWPAHIIGRLRVVLPTRWLEWAMRRFS
jgi:short-subunit dehydrogenase